MKELLWKDIQLEGALLADQGSLEGLIGIQELTNYEDDVVCKSRKRSKSALDEVSEKPKYAKVDYNDKRVHKKTLKNKQKQLKPAKEKNVAKIQISNGFTVEDLSEPITPDTSLIDSSDVPSNDKVLKRREIGMICSSSEGAEGGCENSITVEDLHGWNGLDLPTEILQALADLKFTSPTPIQALTLPPAILGRRDILGAAETGSGKTLAFGIPIIYGILNLKSQLSTKSLNKNKDNEIEAASKPLYALILTPTRELAIQVKNHLVSIAKYTDIKIAVIMGGMASVKQERLLKYGPEIVVATPGRLWELIQENNVHLSKVDGIRFLAIDETDRMVERGHFNELQLLLERLNSDEANAKDRQNFVFSATLTLVHDLPKHLIMKKKRGAKILNQTPGQKLQNLIQLLGISNPKTVDVTHETGMASSLTECRISCPIEHKDYYLYYLLLRYPGRTLVFCNSISCVRRLTQLFTILECKPLPLHASMQQRQRLKNLERFRDDPRAVLVSTDVAARGLDIPDVQHVIHYQVPRSSENYIHRSGRTARATKQGITILIMEPTECKNYTRLCRTLGKVEDLPLFPIDESLLTAMKKRINLAREIDSLELQVRRSQAQDGWFQKNAEEMDILLDDDNNEDDEGKENLSARKRTMNVKRKQLESLLSKPLFPRGYSSRFPTSNGILDVPSVDGHQSKQNAVDIMKEAIENYKRSGRKTPNTLKMLRN